MTKLLQSNCSKNGDDGLSSWLLAKLGRFVFCMSCSLLFVFVALCICSTTIYSHWKTANVSAHASNTMTNIEVSHVKISKKKSQTQAKICAVYDIYWSSTIWYEWYLIWKLIQPLQYRRVEHFSASLSRKHEINMHVRYFRR